MTTLVIAVAFGLLVLLSGCGSQESPEDTGRLSVFVSIQPQSYFLDQLGGQDIENQVMVGPGQSPATYEPTPAQMSALDQADLYFTIGVPFEKGLLPRIRRLYPGLRIVDTHEGIELRHLQEHFHGDEGDHGLHEDMDPHIWLDPSLAKEMARNMAQALAEVDPAHEDVFTASLIALETRLDSLDKAIRAELQELQGRTFYVFHPAYGYFAAAYGLNQVAVEIGGKEPSAQQLAQFIERARADSILLILVQPQFSTASAEAIAGAVGARVAKADPLAYDYFESMKELTRIMRSSLASTEGE